MDLNVLDLAFKQKIKECKGLIACIPVTLNVKDGFHHDLNARAKEDLEGPSFPC